MAVRFHSTFRCVNNPFSHDTLTHPRMVPPRPMASLIRFYTRLGSIPSVYGKQSRPLLAVEAAPTATLDTAFGSLHAQAGGRRSHP